MSLNHWIDDDDTTADGIHYFDKSNNFSFVVSRHNDTTFISPTMTEGLVELRIGVLLPFHQKDSEATKKLTLSGASAIRMAVAEINTQRMIPGAYITLIEKDSYPKEAEGQASITQAVYAAVSLIQKGVIGVIGDVSSSWTSLSALMTSTLQIPQCSFSAVATSLSDKTQYGYFFRTISTNLAYTDAALTFVLSQGWPMIGILYSDDDFGQQLSQNMIMKARTQGIKVTSYQTFYSDGPVSDVQTSVETLMATGSRIILLAAENDAQLTALTVAAHLGYINNDTVWITFGENTDALWNAVDRFNSVITRRINHVNIYNNTNGNNTYQWMTNVDPIEYAANSTAVLNTIAFNSTFAGGVFMFRYRLNLTGYAPYDEFMRKWAKLDPAMAAYSCMMAMAHGFNHVIQNSTNTNSTMKKLAAGQLGEYMTPSTFNTSFVGPEGPVLFDENGDTMKGNPVYIGSIIANDLHLISEPIYHDGTVKVPTGTPDQKLLTTSSTALTYAIMSVASFGILAAIATILLVLIYRKRETFKASRNLIAKNYRVYRIFNNIFITRTVVRDFQLLKVSGGILAFDAVILMIWLSTSEVQTVDVPVSSSAYYVGCDFHGPTNMVFVWILTVFAAMQLAFATFLAFKTRSVGKNYSKYSEYKQIGLSV
ncbi:hypothetical protein EC973_003632 [Apophysomyces ossiformis]|uniref:G-protein coupled receptors family 3 profile domain-containing protein n=1 Tax=Apophysomyces ossiformis TaxID=679940 RepID=A0A8H7BXB5_9FUNG|nr:hypothetical protein EC973_003632 [Apophysomyces ossiformis]